MSTSMEVDVAIVVTDVVVIVIDYVVTKDLLTQVCGHDQMASLLYESIKSCCQLVAK